MCNNNPKRDINGDHQIKQSQHGSYTTTYRSFLHISDTPNVYVYKKNSTYKKREANQNTQKAKIMKLQQFLLTTPYNL